jgi:hypothetical protein
MPVHVPSISHDQNAPLTSALTGLSPLFDQRIAAVALRDSARAPQAARVRPPMPTRTARDAIGRVLPSTLTPANTASPLASAAVSGSLHPVTMTVVQVIERANKVVRVWAMVVTLSPSSRRCN